MTGRSDGPQATGPAREVGPYGSWRSPVTAKLMAEGGVSTMWPQSAGESLYWTEMRPLEDGRYVVVRRAPGGAIADVTPPGASARTLVHEYGGGMYVAFRSAGGGESVVFSEQKDQRLYRQDLTATTDGTRRGCRAEPRRGARRDPSRRRRRPSAPTATPTGGSRRTGVCW